jgi:hypothetical protein
MADSDLSALIVSKSEALEVGYKSWIDATGKPRGETVSHEIKDGRIVPKK